jgi:hypothetical protein
MIKAIIRDPGGTEFTPDSSLLRVIDELTEQDLTTPWL